MGCSDLDAVVQVKQEMGELSQAGRRDKRQVQKLQLELLQAKQLLEKLRGNKQVIPISHPHQHCCHSSAKHPRLQ